VLATLSNGVVVTGGCLSVPVVEISISRTRGNLDMSGTYTTPAGTQSADLVAPGGFGVQDALSVDFDVIARDDAVGPFARIDAHGEMGSPCTFWGMITPSS
jgi:hypothetical protein